MAEEAIMSNNTRITVSSLAAEVAALRESQQAFQAKVLGALAGLTGEATVEAPKSTRKGKGKGKKARKPEGVTFKTLQMRLKEHKAAGLIKAGTTVREAIAAGLMTDEGAFCGTTPAPEPKKSTKKARKAKATVAEVKATAPAKPVAADAPRRADGTITPKSEWALREALAETGQYDRFEIDRMVEAVNNA